MYELSSSSCFSNVAFLKWSISQMEHFSNGAFLKWSISQMEQFSNGAILKWSDSQMEQFSNGAIWGRHPMPYFKIPRTEKYGMRCATGYPQVISTLGIPLTPHVVCFANLAFLLKKIAHLVACALPIEIFRLNCSYKEVDSLTGPPLHWPLVK